jgi:hypothetical protein
VRELGRDGVLGAVTHQNASVPCHELARERSLTMTHPHPDKRHVMVAMRRYLLAAKKRFGQARGLCHYQDLLQTYVTAKRAL